MNNNRAMLTCIVAVLFTMSLSPALVTSAGLTGDPLPASGNWHIENATVVTGESIVVNGNTTLEEGASLHIIDSSVSFNGNVSMMANSTLVVENSTIVFNGTVFSERGTTQNISLSSVSLTGDMLITGTRFNMEDSTVFFDDSPQGEEGYFMFMTTTLTMRNVSVDTHSDRDYMVGFLDAGSTSTAFIHNSNFADGGIAQTNSSTALFMTNVALYSNSQSLVLEGCSITPRYGHGAYIEQSYTSVFNTTIETTPDLNSSYGIKSVYSMLTIGWCDITGNGIFLKQSYAYVHNITVINSTTAPVPEYETGDENITWIDETYGITVSQSIIDLEWSEISGMTHGLVLSDALSHPQTGQMSNITNNTFSSNIHGMYMYRATGFIRDNNIGGNDVGLRAINSPFIADLQNQNVFSSPENNSEDAIRFERLLDIRITRTGGEPLWGASVVSLEMNWTGLSRRDGIAEINGGVPFEAYILGADGLEKYFTYNITASYNTSYYTSSRSYFLDALNATVPSELIELELDAGPDLELNFIRLSTNIAPSGSVIQATLNITNHWWYSVENVKVRVESFSESNETVIPVIPANTTVEVTLSISVGRSDVDSTVVIRGMVDPDKDIEGTPIDRDNNWAEESVTIKAALPDSTAPTTGILVAIVILLPVFLFSLYRSLKNKRSESAPYGGEEEKTDVEGEYSQEETEEKAEEPTPLENSETEDAFVEEKE